MNEERVVRRRFTAATSSLQLVEDAIAHWHTVLARAERAAIALALDSLAHVSLRAAAREASRELHRLHERGRAFTAIRRWIVRLSAGESRWDAFAREEDTAELYASGPDA